jgi:predicted DNA-binding transcriptional regulator AlpA
MDEDLRIVFDSLERRLDGLQRLGPKELSAILGLKTGTIYNQMSTGRFPIPVSKNGGHPRCRLIDVAKYLCTTITKD